VVDTNAYGPAAGPRPSAPVSIGWIGSPSTWPFVKPLVPLLVEGKSEREIAETIGRSRHTVHDHTKRIYRAFGVHTRVELAARWNGTVAWTGGEFPSASG